MKKIEYEELVGTLRELEGLYYQKIKEVLTERDIYGILFSDDRPACCAAAILQGADEPEYTFAMVKIEKGKLYVSLNDDEYEDNYVENAVCFTAEQYKEGILDKIDQQDDSNWAKHFADIKAWRELSKIFDYEEECCGARAFVLDGIYKSVCIAINECADDAVKCDEEQSVEDAAQVLDSAPGVDLILGDVTKSSVSALTLICNAEKAACLVVESGLEISIDDIFEYGNEFDISSDEITYNGLDSNTDYDLHVAVSAGEQKASDVLEFTTEGDDDEE